MQFPMKTCDAAATAAALPFARLVPALQALFAQGCVVPPRHVHEVPVPGGAPFTSLIMPAWIPGRYYGIKTINIAPANAARGLPGLHASYMLYDGATGAPLAPSTATRSRTGAPRPPRRSRRAGSRARMPRTCWWWAPARWLACSPPPMPRCAPLRG
jgi:ornithine cyclodeaminase/alanine dehydrogenase-like protein (mu-crystallin family)